MLGAITYQEMLNGISKNKVDEDTIGILITRPDLDTGKNILGSLNHYHHLSGENINFYLPGYGAYWYGVYPDEQLVTKIDGVDRSFSDQAFVQFINDLEEQSKWEYSGESELLLLDYKNNRLSLDNILEFYLDNMLRDNVIDSISSFFQKLIRLCKGGKDIKKVSDSLGRDKLVQVTKDSLINIIPSYLGNVFTQERHFCVRNFKK